MAPLEAASSSSVGPWECHLVAGSARWLLPPVGALHQFHSCPLCVLPAAGAPRAELPPDACCRPLSPASFPSQRSICVERVLS